MKLLFDQNLSPRLVLLIADLYPDSTHVSRVGLDRATDMAVYRFARRNGFTLVTKDADFADIGLVYGFPPRVIWLQLGNCTTSRIADILRTGYEAVLALESSPDVGVLVLS